MRTARLPRSGPSRRLFGSSHSDLAPLSGEDFEDVSALLTSLGDTGFRGHLAAHDGADAGETGLRCAVEVFEPLEARE